MLKKQGVQDLMLNSVLGNMHELARSLMMGTIEKQKVGNDSRTAQFHISFWN